MVTEPLLNREGTKSAVGFKHMPLWVCDRKDEAGIIQYIGYFLPAKCFHFPTLCAVLCPEPISSCWGQKNPALLVLQCTVFHRGKFIIEDRQILILLNEMSLFVVSTTDWRWDFLVILQYTVRHNYLQDVLESKNFVVIVSNWEKLVTKMSTFHEPRKTVFSFVIMHFSLNQMGFSNGYLA